MRHIERFRFPKPLHCAPRALLAAACVLPLLTAPAPANAQAKPSPATQQLMVRCLMGCNRGDAGCQGRCIKKAPSPAYSTCVRTCADASSAPAQQQSQAEDLKICVQACN